MAGSESIGRDHDSSGPIEYKDAPIRFTFILDDREEPVKIVEPTIDLPFPDGGRLLVNETEKRLCDVVFRFDPEGMPLDCRLRDYRISDRAVPVLDRHPDCDNRLDLYRFVQPGRRVSGPFGLYGRSQALRDLTFRRDDPSGQRAHEDAVSDQKSRESRQARDDVKYRRQRKGDLSA